MEDASEKRSRKRQKLNKGDDDFDDEFPTDRNHIPRTLYRSVSPPPLRRALQSPQIMESPFQLTWIQDLPKSLNVDAVSLKNILGDPLIAECWEFNYLHDLDFLMDAFDEDVRSLVKVHVIHGFWKHEDTSRQNLKLQASNHPNITLHTAFMPEMFGTHHSKMLILIRHDATAQVIIHTANMIAFDWTNMAQAVWRSPLLPETPNDVTLPESNKIGSGSKFKKDLLNYLKAYDTKRVICKPLIEQLSKYDFSAVRAALVASVPGKQDIETDAETSWGWPGLKNVLSAVPVKTNEPEIVLQISSIATLGATDKWLEKTLFSSLGASKNMISKPKFSVIFPTADEVRRSLNGYQSGSAIHTKIQSVAQAKQLQFLKPIFCHWAADGAQHTSTLLTPVSDAGRKRAAPHIKTYIRFGDKSTSSIDWMLVTSANLSKQAWGEAMNSAGEIRVCSYEVGVMVWPELYGDDATMIPTFKTDSPPADLKTKNKIVVGARMPYDLPLVPYKNSDIPWCATASYTEPDWLGETWRV
ncbi:putative tyrosyl-DNA phosphodiesterase [Lachnellula subtilissima]|uniref:Putative tyrosyl-DNA phosphodiesterase n=1 Tax=Lachnellula subtilissima TaxID=602034 RepID=A0A8H8RII5_9HELO|nr:putative tyrosyl-DNA phosphodiesterase [Lachnellula subtilissima]